MIINIGLILNESQISIKTLETEDSSIESKSISFEELTKENLNLLFFEDINNLDAVAQVLKVEEDSYPIVDINSVEIKRSEFDNLNFSDLMSAFDKINTRWVLSNNMQTIEKLYEDTVSLKELWKKDHNQFFKNLWSVFKKNLAATELTIIFNDLKEPTPAAKEKGEKPTLCHTSIKGKKVAEFISGSEAEKELMKEYKKEFNDAFNITEYNTTRGQLVICSNVNKSPILFMATVPTLNQLQRSVLSGLMNGLQ